MNISDVATLSKISFNPMELGAKEREYVLECVDSTWISSVGRFITEFEQGIATLTGAETAIACTNGEIAVHLALVALGIGAGDEVILPSLADVAMANAVINCGATPVFIDNCAHRLTLDASQLEALVTPRTKAVFAPQTYGNFCDNESIHDFAKSNNLRVLIEATHALGYKYNCESICGLCDCIIFNFSGNTIINTGEGGAIATSNTDLAAKIRLLRGQGMDPNRRYWFPVVGYNYRMTNIQAAIGLAQLEGAGERRSARSQVRSWYRTKLAALEDRVIDVGAHEEGSEAVGLCTVLLRQSAQRDRVVGALQAAGIECRPVFTPVHLMPPYARFADKRLPQAEASGAAGLNLPIHARLSEGDVERVVTALDEATRS